jgi:hypothetical protein
LQANGHEEFLHGDVDASAIIFESHVVEDSTGVHQTIIGKTEEAICGFSVVTDGPQLKINSAVVEGELSFQVTRANWGSEHVQTFTSNKVKRSLS